MTTMGLVRLLRRHVYVVLTFVVLGVTAATLLAMFVVTPTYMVSMKLYVSARGSTPDDRLQNSEYARTHVSSYTDMVDSNDILQAVRAELGLPVNRDSSYADLADSITASNPLETAIINVTVQDASAERAFRVATAIGEVYDPAVAKMENTGVNQSPVRVNVLSAPVLPTSPHSPSRPLYAAGGLVLGLALGTGLAWLLEARPARQRRRLALTDQGPADSWSWEADPAAQEQNPVWEHGSDEVVRPIRGEGGRKGSKRVAQGQHEAATEQRNAAQ